MIFGVPEDLFNTAKDYMVQPYRGQKSIGAWVIEATEFKYEARSHLGIKKPKSTKKIQYYRGQRRTEIHLLKQLSSNSVHIT